MKLPNDYMEEGLQMAENWKVLGVPLTELSREELLASAAHALEEKAKDLKLHKESLRLLKHMAKLQAL